MPEIQAYQSTENSDGTKSSPLLEITGETIGTQNLLHTSTGAGINETPVTFEDTSFVSGDSPATLDINTGLGRNATEFNITNDGAGEFTVSISNDGTIFGDEHTTKNGETYAIDNISVDSIRITHVTDSSYRVIAI